MGECFIQTNLGSRIIKATLCVLWQKTCESGKSNLSVLCITLESLYEVRHSPQQSVMVRNVSVEIENERFVDWENDHKCISINAVVKTTAIAKCQRNSLSYKQVNHHIYKYNVILAYMLWWRNMQTKTILCNEPSVPLTWKVWTCIYFHWFSLPWFRDMYKQTRNNTVTRGKSVVWWDCYQCGTDEVYVYSNQQGWNKGLATKINCNIWVWLSLSGDFIQHTMLAQG